MTETLLITELLKQSPGYVVEVSGLYVSRMKNGQYHVVYDPLGTENIFSSAGEATLFFVAKRRELKLGF